MDSKTFPETELSDTYHDDSLQWSEINDSETTQVQLEGSTAPPVTAADIKTEKDSKTSESSPKDDTSTEGETIKRLREEERKMELEVASLRRKAEKTTAESSLRRRLEDLKREKVNIEKSTTARMSLKQSISNLETEISVTKKRQVEGSTATPVAIADIKTEKGSKTSESSPKDDTSTEGETIKRLREEERKMELEVASLRRKAEKTTAESSLRRRLEDLKREKVNIEKSTTARMSLKQSISNLETEVNMKKKRQIEIAEVLRLMTRSQHVDLCFLIDCTGSMSSYINEVKSKIQMIVDKTKQAFPELNLSVAFVGYRDHCDGIDRTVVSDFTPSIPQFQCFVDAVEAKGGGDTAEDVFGGLEEVAKLTWNKHTRILFHIADAPCHGNRFHEHGLLDEYPEGDPRGLQIEDLLSKIQELNIIYWFAKLGDTTDKMIQEFKSVFDGRQEINQIEMSSVKDLVGAVAGSISLSINVNERTLADQRYNEKGKLRSFRLDMREPNWASVKIEKAIVQKNKIPSDLEKIRLPLEIDDAESSIKMAPNPFAEGGLRVAYYGVDCTSSSTRNIVLKEFKHVGGNLNKLGRYLKQMEIQAVAITLAKKFNKIKPKEVRSIHFAEVSVVTFTRDKRQTHFTQERRIQGKYLKFSSNVGYVNKEEYTATLHAFSHWTYYVTNKYLMVVDLQGVKEETSEGTKYILTDPAIHCSNVLRFGETNLGREGIYKFFRTHCCSSICKAMSLPIHRHQVSGDYTDVAGATVVGKKW